MRRSRISLRLGGIGGDLDEAIFTRQSLIEELLAQQYKYNSTAVAIKDEIMEDTAAEGAGDVILFLSAWDNKNITLSAPSAAKSTPVVTNGLTASKKFALPLIENTAKQGGWFSNLNTETNSNSRTNNMRARESNTMTVMIDENDLVVDDYEVDEDEDEDQDEDDSYEYGEDEDDYDDEDLDSLDLAEALRIVRGQGKRALSMSGTTRNKMLKRKADSNNKYQPAQVGNDFDESGSENQPIDSRLKMVRIVIQNETSSSLDKNIILQDKPIIGVQSSGSVAAGTRSPVYGLVEDSAIPSHQRAHAIEAFEAVDKEIFIFQ